MNQSLTTFDIKLIILLIIFMLIKSVYNLYVFNEYNLHAEETRNLFIFYKKYPFFNIISLLTALLYLFSSIYFYMANKIKTTLFGLFCLYMLWRSVGYFATVFGTHIPGLSTIEQNIYTYYNIEVTSIITILFTVYLIKVLFIG